MASLLAGIKGAFIPATIQIAMDDASSRPTIQRPHSTDPEDKLLLYGSKEPIKGTVTVTPLPGKKVDFNSITCEFAGIIEVFDEKKQSNNFITVTKELAQEGTLTQAQSYPFDFTSIKKEYETYYGVNVNLRYAPSLLLLASLALPF